MALNQRQLAFLFATGILKSSGGGGGGKGGKTVTYSKKRAKEVKALSGKGAPASTFRRKTANVKGMGGTRNGPDKFQRTAIQGKAAHLRSGSGGGGRRVPSKAERDATREERLTRGNQRLEQYIGRRVAALRRHYPANRKEMSAKYPGTYADTGRAFNAGDKIFYGDGGAHQRRGSLTAGELRYAGKGPPKNRNAAINRAAVAATSSSINYRQQERADNNYYPKGDERRRERREGARAGRNGKSASNLTLGFKHELRERGLAPGTTRRLRTQLARELSELRSERGSGVAREQLAKLKASPKWKFVFEKPRTTRPRSRRY